VGLKWSAQQDLPTLQFWSKSDYPSWSYCPFFIKTVFELLPKTCNFTICSIFSNSGHVGWCTASPDTILKLDTLVMIQNKFGFHWSSTFRGEDFWKSLRCTTDGRRRTPSDGNSSHDPLGCTLLVMCVWSFIISSVQLNFYSCHFNFLIFFSYGGSDHIYNYLFNQYLTPLTLWVILPYVLFLVTVAMLVGARHHRTQFWN
jgi:hypothetical protein